MAAVPATPRELHVLVAGAGGIGCPAAWALAAAGVGRITLLDPDVVEPSNLPRQVLFRAADVGRAKAPTAAAALPPGVFAGGLPQRLDDGNAAELLDGVHVLIDATDGAPAKDWINQWAVRRGVPLVHAAGLRSEARLLCVRPGGRPCLACLFGRLQQETGSCADLGVWNGVVGVVGALAAEAAVRLALEPRTAPAGYAVLDFASGHALTLAARAQPDCPVCAAPAAPEPYPAPAACAAPAAPGGAAAAPEADAALDLRAERCPHNLLRARRALEDLAPGRVLAIDLGEEGAATVPDGVRALGHEVLQAEPRGGGLRLRVRAGARSHGPALAPADLQRFARQVVLPEVGEAGQARLAAARVRLLGAGPAARAARAYLEAAGLGQVLGAGAGPADLTAWAAGAPPPAGLVPDVGLEASGGGWRAALEPARPLGLHDAPPAVAVALGALLADLVQRRLVPADPPRATFRVHADARVD